MLCDVCLEACTSHGPIPRQAVDAAVDALQSDPYSVGRSVIFEHTVPHHSTFSSLKSSVDLDCLLCTKFWESQKSSVIEWLEQEIAASGVKADLQTSLPAPSTKVARSGTQLALNISVITNFHGRENLEIHGIFVDGYDADPENRNLQKSKLFNKDRTVNVYPEGTLEAENVEQCSASLDSAETFAQANSWISQCHGHHLSCSKSLNWYPTRLLDSGPLESAEKVFVRLHETGTNGSVTEGPYMTLSYCWGTEAPLTLTERTHPQLSAGMFLDDLPKAFRDAIYICRKLGVRYLWIDALCIFQDKGDEGEVSDWHREASQMHKVYSNTWCNISAAGGVGSSSPILRPRAPHTLRHNKIPIQWLYEDGTTTKSFYTLIDHNLWAMNVDGAHVNRRAWVMQERMLSPRILHFTDSRIFWECFEHRASEDFPQIWPRESSTKPLPWWKAHNKKDLPYTDNDESGPTSQDSREEGPMRWRWCLLVEQYTKSQLTVPTDRLVAISAIARRIATYLQDDYVAGLWRRSLEHDLLWSKGTPAHEPPSTAKYVAPSWSWAAAEGRTLFPGGEFVGGWPNQPGDIMFAEVLDVNLEYTSGDVFGSLQGGRLLLRGVLQPIQLLPTFPEVCGLDGAELIEVEETYFEPGSALYGVTINGRGVPDDQAFVYLDSGRYKRYEEENRDGCLFCMLVCKYDPSTNAAPWSFLVFQAVDRAEGVFRRIGVLVLRSEEESETAALSRHEDEASFPCLEYGNRKHTICFSSLVGDLPLPSLTVPTGLPVPTAIRKTMVEELEVIEKGFATLIAKIAALLGADGWGLYGPRDVLLSEEKMAWRSGEVARNGTD